MLWGSSPSTEPWRELCDRTLCDSSCRLLCRYHRHVVSPIACSLPLGVLHPTGEAVGLAGNKCAGCYLPLFAHTRGGELHISLSACARFGMDFTVGGCVSNCTQHICGATAHIGMTQMMRARRSLVSCGPLYVCQHGLFEVPCCCGPASLQCMLCGTLFCPS